MLPTETLSGEHRTIERVLAILDRACDKFAKDDNFDLTIFSDSLDFIRNFADRSHHIKEEDTLFRRMSERGFPYQDGPIGVMIAEHEEGRRYVRGLAEALERHAKGDSTAKRDIIQNARGYAGLLGQHIPKEDNILYPMANNALSPQDQTDLSERFAKLETEVIGAGGRERYLALVDKLEKAV